MRSIHAAAVLVAALAACSHETMFRTEGELAPQVKTASVDRPAKVARDASVRAGPSGGSPVIAQLAAGADVTAAQTPSNGYFRVKTAQGQSGFVEAAAVTFAPAAGAASAPPASAPAAEPGTESVR